MKFTKKFVAILLATVMIFAVCTFSAFAETISTYDKDYPTYNVGYFYYLDFPYDINGEGTLDYDASNHSVELRVYCQNIGYDSVSEYHLYAQCAVNYTDGTQDFFTVSRRMFIAPSELVAYIFDTFYLPSNKTVESFDAEFFIWYENESLWEAYIHGPLT